MRKLKHEEIPRPSPEEVSALPRHPVVGLLDNIRSIYNVGSIFRTSDAALIEHLYLTGITGTPEHSSLHKTALGAQDTVQWSHHEDPVAVVEDLQKAGFTIGVLEITNRPTSPRAAEKAHFPLCLVIGNEVHGVREELVDRADIAFEIPQYGAKQSLNVAVAYGIALFDIIRCYRTMQPDDQPVADFPQAERLV